MSAGDPISFRLSPEAIETLEWAKENLGLKRSAVVELALRDLKARREQQHEPTPRKKLKKSD